MNEKLEPIVIRCVNDIRKAIRPFIKEVEKNKVELKETMYWEDDGKKNSAEVTAISSDVSMRQALLDGFEQVKQQEKMLDDLHEALDDDEYAPALPRVDVDEVPMRVDKIIKYRLGGKREGLTVVWEIGGQKVVFDPYTKELHEFS